MSAATTQYVAADEYNALKRDHEKLKDAHARLHKAATEIQHKAYEEGREAARREYSAQGSRVELGEGFAQLMLPDDGGCIQFHTVGQSAPRPLVGGILTPAPDYSLRIWGPPDEGGSYGVYEQGGGNLTDFSMQFDLTPQGIVIYRMDTTGIRTKWEREPR